MMHAPPKGLCGSNRVLVRPGRSRARRKPQTNWGVQTTASYRSSGNKWPVGSHLPRVVFDLKESELPRREQKGIELVMEGSHEDQPSRLPWRVCGMDAS